MKQLTNYKRVTEYLDKIFNLLNAEYFNSELPQVVLTVQSTPRSYGHFTTYDAWHCNDNAYKEINIGAGTLDRPIENITATLLHEMIHLYCNIHSIKDVSRGGSYHNSRFKAEAEKRGLIIEYDSRIGHPITYPSENLLSFCIENNLEDIQISRDDFSGFFTGGKSATGRTAKRTNNNYRRYVCPICGSIARTTKDMILICGTCMEHMKQT